MSKIDQIDEEIEKETADSKKEFEEIMENRHTKFINEADFEDDAEKYEEFVNAYIH